jgi:hypothetical protein
VAHGKGSSAPCAWTNRCRAPCYVAHGKGQSQPCALTTLCRVPCHVAHDKEYYRSRACSAAHGREGVTPFPAEGRQHLFFAVRHLLRTATNCAVRCIFPKRTAKSAIPVAEVGQLSHLACSKQETKPL